MKIKKRFLFDEEKKAKEIVENGFEENKVDYGDIYLVAKYLRQKEKLGAVRLERRLIEFCKEQDKNFNPVKNKREIKKWVKSAMNYNLRKVDTIFIAQEEIDFLKTIESNRDRKILFMILVFVRGAKKANTRREKREHKKSDKYYLHYNNFKDIVKMTELTNISETKLAKILHKYKEHFLFYNPEKEIIRVDYVTPSSDFVKVMKDLDNPLETYQEIFGKNMSYCELCGKEIVKKSNRQISCEECSGELARQRTKRWRENLE